ncbi:hypothetical protein [Kitasatospora griseola]
MLSDIQTSLIISAAITLMTSYPIRRSSRRIGQATQQDVHRD